MERSEKIKCVILATMAALFIGALASDSVMAAQAAEGPAKTQKQMLMTPGEIKATADKVFKTMSECNSREQQNSAKGCFIVRYYDDGDKVNKITSYRNGVPDGYELQYYDSGKLWKATAYKNGIKDGTMYEFTSQGVLSRETPYQEDQVNGQWRFFYDSGRIKDDLSFKNGKRHGISRHFYPDTAVLQMEEHYKNGTLNGKTTFFKEDGSPKFHVTYKDGKPISGKCAKGRALTIDELDHIMNRQPDCK